MSRWPLRQLEKLSETDPGLVENMLSHFQKSDPERHEKLVIGAYLDRDISLGKAAELLGMHPVELRKEFVQRGIPIHLGSESIEDLYAEIAAAEQIRARR